MITSEGLTKMYMYKCNNYPLCDFNKDEFFEINEINHMSTWSNKYFNKSLSPIDAEQYFMIVNCENLVDGVPCGECISCKNIFTSNDVVEIDAATNNGVDEIRDLREKVNFVPSICKYKV